MTFRGEEDEDKSSSMTFIIDVPLSLTGCSGEGKNVW